MPQLTGISRYGTRAERELLTRGPGGHDPSAAADRPRAVRLAETEFLLVAPGAGEPQAADLVRLVTAEVEQLGDVYPFVPMHPVSAVTVTRKQPLPLTELRKTVGWAETENLAIALLPS